MLSNPKKTILFFILSIAFIFRFYQLGINPPSLNWDETSIGYNAYSISQTLRDEHGRFLPIDYFAAFGDYKPPAYIYLTVPFVKFLGLNALSVRLPSAILGFLTVILTYFLAKNLFKNEIMALSAAFVLALSPWHVLVSRAAFEANVATFFIILGVFLFWCGINKKPVFLIFASLSLTISLYTFNSTRLFLPFFLLALGIIFRNELFKIKKWVVAAGAIGLILLLPLIPHLFSKEGQLRFKEVNIFTDPQPVITANQRSEVDKNVWWVKIIHNRRLGFALSFAKHYFDHFSADYLFISGDINPKFSSRDTGQLYLIELPFLLAGIYLLLKRKDKVAALILSWLLLGFVPSATARETPHALRSLVCLPTWQILVGLGLSSVLMSLQKKRSKAICYLLLATGYFLSVFYFLHNYYIHYPKEFSGDWQYGYQKVVNFTKSVEANYDEIWVTNQYGRPYIFFLFYGKYEPQFFWQQGKVWVDEFGFYHVDALGKYKFGKFNLAKIDNKKVLLIGGPREIPKEFNRLKIINFLDSKTAFEIAETR